MGDLITVNTKIKHAQVMRKSDSDAKISSDSVFINIYILEEC